MLIWPSMGDLSTEAMNVASLRQGIHSTHLPLPDVYSTQLARNVASGKECIPALLVLGSILQFFRDTNPDTRRRHLPRLRAIDAGTVPHRAVPCLLRSALRGDGLGERGAACGPARRTRIASWARRSPGMSGARLVLGDYFTDIRTSLRLLARDPAAALAHLRSPSGRTCCAPSRRARKSSTGS